MGSWKWFGLVSAALLLAVVPGAVAAPEAAIAAGEAATEGRASRSLRRGGVAALPLDEAPQPPILGERDLGLERLEASSRDDSDILLGFSRTWGRREPATGHTPLLNAKPIPTKATKPQPIALKQAEPQALPLQIDGTLTDDDLALDDESRFDEYSFVGQAGQIVKITLSSAEFNTYLLVNGPNGEVARNDDGPEGTDAQVVVRLPVDGTYRALANAYDAEGRGAYQLAVDTATVAELQRSERRAEVKEIYDLGVEQYDAQQWREAAQSYEAALAGYRELGNRAGEANTLNNIGGVYGLQGNYPEALETYEESLALQRELGDRAGEANTLNNIGIVYRLLGNYPEALETYEESLALKRELGDRAGEAITLGNIGIVYENLGNYPEALETYEESLALKRELGNRAGEANTLNNIGVVYQKLGNYPEALETYEESLALKRELGNRAGEATTIGNIGIVYDLLGNYPEALETYEESLALQRELGNRAGEANTLNNIGNVYQKLGNYPEALETYEESLALTRELGDRAGEAITLGNIGIVYENLGNYPEALETYEESLALKRELGDRAGEAITLGNIGIVYENLGNYPEALETYEESLALKRELGDRAGEATTLGNIGIVYRLLGNYPEALKTYEESLALQRELGNRAGEALTLANIGKLLDTQQQPELAITFLKRSIDTYEGIRATNQTLDPDLQESYTATIEDDYRLLADLLLQQDRIIEAQRVLELLKVQELDGYLRGIRRGEATDAEVSYRDPESEILRLYQEKQDELIALGQELAQLAEIGLEDRTQEEIDRITTLRKLEGEVRRQFKGFLQTPEIQTLVAQLQRTTGAASLDLAQINGLRDNLKALGQDAVVLYPLVLSDRVELVLVSANAAPIRRTSIVDKTELNETIGELRYALEHPSRDAQTPAQQLYNWLIAPLENDLAQANAKTIIYAPDGQLRYIPLAVLYDGTDWLARRFQVNNITTSDLADLNTEPATGNIRILAAAFSEGEHDIVVGDRPISYTGLTHAGQEVDSLASMIPQTVQRLNEAFNADIVYEMDDYQIIHLATHAEFNPGPPENSFIVFGNGDHANLTDIERWTFPNVELIVLSACQTAVGDVPLGDGKEILGFGYRMQQAGADAAIASLWSVDDGGTQLLMEAFYDALSRGGLTKAAAVQQAQVAFLDGAVRRGGLALADGSTLDPSDLAHPHYWAPFILIGNGL